MFPLYFQVWRWLHPPGIYRGIFRGDLHSHQGGRPGVVPSKEPSRLTHGHRCFTEPGEGGLLRRQHVSFPPLNKRTTHFEDQIQTRSINFTPDNHLFITLITLNLPLKLTRKLMPNIRKEVSDQSRK